MKILCHFLLLSLLSTGIAYSQSLPDSTKIKIDKFFDTWNKANSPGCAIGIVRNDSLIYAKGYGMADLEYSVPISERTIFHMASVSKQFTAYSIILLEQQGKLKLDDDIRLYLKWFPDLKEKITIRNLLNHTSGIRDQWQLLAISGTRLDDVITQDHIVKILSKQQALNFKPGEKHSYSNSGFTMLAEIVKSITGQSLRQFTDSAIFKPLGMINTHFHDDYTEIVPNRSYSYQRKDSVHFTNSILSYSNAGATSLFTNVDDMSKWIMNLYNPKVGNKETIALLTQNGKLNNGKEINYAAGIVSDKYRGWRQYSHGGGDAGFRTYINVFPDLKLGFIFFANLGDINSARMTYQMANLFVNDTTKKAEVQEDKRDSTLALTRTDYLKKFTGDYITNTGSPLSIELMNNKLYYRDGNTPYLLTGETNYKFSVFIAPDIKFIFSESSNDTSFTVLTPGDDYLFKKYKKIKSPGDNLLKSYTGTYYCPELNCSYGIVIRDHNLYLTNSKYDDAKLTLEGAEHLMNDTWWMNHLQIIRNKSNAITGFEVNSGRIMHLKFNKVE